MKRGVGSEWEWTRAWRDGRVMREDGLFLAQGNGGGGGGGREGGVMAESSVMVAGLLAGVSGDASQIAALSCILVNGGDASASEEGGEGANHRARRPSESPLAFCNDLHCT